MPEPISFMSVRMALSSRQEVMQAIAEGKPARIATLNPEFMLEARRNQAFRQSLSQMTHCTIDGAGLFYFLKLYFFLKRRQNTLEKVRGADLVQELFQRYHKGEKSFFFLGGSPGLSSQAKKKVENLYPGIVISGEDSGGAVDSVNPTLDPALMKKIQEANPDVLLVGFGCPKQELWMEKASHHLRVPTMIGVGGTFGFYSSKTRAPQWIRSLNLEWLYRAMTEKGHWKRAFRAVFVFSFLASSWILRDLISLRPPKPQP